MVNDIVEIKRTLISAYDKRGLEQLLQCLQPSTNNIEIISSGGTAKEIRRLGYNAIDVSDYTGYPESPNGLVKTLHPKIHGGLLLDTENPKHAEYMHAQSIQPIDLVVVNLYPFKETVKKPNSTIEDIREQIDIGGPAMLRAAAKNFKRVAVLVNWDDAKTIRNENNKIYTTLADRVNLMKAAFKHTAAYDTAIAEFMANQPVQAISLFYTRGK